MDWVFWNRVLIPVFGIAFLALAFVRPLVALWRSSRVWGVVFQKDAHVGQRWMGRAVALMWPALLVWTLLYAARGPEAVHTWGTWPALSVVGWLLALSGLALAAVAQNQMGDAWRIGIDDRSTPLVTEGLFHFVRNPIFTSVLGALAGVVCIAPSFWTLGFWFVLALFVAIQVRFEEQHLLALHGAYYRDYAQRVGRFIPGIGKLR